MVNAYEYINKYEGFDVYVHQKTSPDGYAQAFWYVFAYASKGDSLASCENASVTGIKGMALTDDVICFNVVGVLKKSGANAIIPVMCKKTNTRIQYTREENTAASNRKDEWTTNENVIKTVNQSVYNLFTTVNEIMTVPSDTESVLKKYYGFSPATIAGDSINLEYYNASINSTPTFRIEDSEGIQNYLNTADRTGALTDYSVDWTVYIDEPEIPNAIKLVWRSVAIEQLFRDGKENADNVYVNLFTYMDADIDNKVIIQSAKYSDSYINTSFLQICEFYDRVAYYDLTSSRPQAFRAKIEMHFELYTINGLYSHGAVTLNYGGDYKAAVYPSNTLDHTTVVVVIGTGNNDNGYTPPNRDNNVGNETESTDGFTALNLLSTTYKISLVALKQLNGVLWAKSFAESIAQINVAPIENIISCKIVPTEITGIADVIELGNYPTRITGYIVQNNVKLVLGEIKIEEYYNSFLDYAPYTKITIFIPYIGFKELDSSQFMGRTIKVEYIIDVVTASCKALLFADDIYVQSFDGQCGIDIPVTASNRAQVEASYISGALGAIGNLASGNVLGATSGALNSAMTPYHYNTQGAYNPSCGSYETKLCYLIIDRPTADYPTTYGHDVGYPCHLSATLSSLKGFTKCYDSIDLSGIPCTEQERDIIHQYLTSGVYI